MFVLKWRSHKIVQRVEYASKTNLFQHCNANISIKLRKWNDRSTRKFSNLYFLGEVWQSLFASDMEINILEENNIVFGWHETESESNKLLGLIWEFLMDSQILLDPTR